MLGGECIIIKKFKSGFGFSKKNNFFIGSSSVSRNTTK